MITTREQIEEAVREVEDVTTGVFAHDSSYMNSLDCLLSIAKLYLRSSEEMPEKRGFGRDNKEHIESHFHGEHHCFECDKNRGFNEAIDLCTPLVMRLKARISELECVLQAWQDVFGTTQLTHAKDRLDVAENEDRKLKARVEELERKNISIGLELASTEQLLKVLREHI